jgi:hypothetical protein
MTFEVRLIDLINNNPRYRSFRHVEGWESTPDDGDHTHCLACGETVNVGDECVVQYVDSTCLAFCMARVSEHYAIIARWIAPSEFS